MKAKWLRVELRKTEILPGVNPQSDPVGPGPLNVWGPFEDWATLESVSILDNRRKPAKAVAARLSFSDSHPRVYPAYYQPWELWHRL